MEGNSQETFTLNEQILQDVIKTVKSLNKPVTFNEPAKETVKDNEPAAENTENE